MPYRNNRFQESYDLKYFNEIKRLKSLQKAEAYLELNEASMMELFCECVYAIKISSWMLD